MVNLVKLIEEIRVSTLLDLRSNIFLTSDTHYNHSKIIEYCNRPYENIENMNKDLIDKYNSMVGKNDIVIHMGDFGFGNRKSLKPIRDALNGYIVLIKGNHDKRNSNKLWYDIGINDYLYYGFETEDFIFTHKPMVKHKDERLNIHGHIHHLEISDRYDKNKHLNVSVDATNFYPVNLSLILRGEYKIGYKEYKYMEGTML